MRPPILRASFDEITVDLFAGGGGTSTGIEGALNRPVDVAINHSPEAIAVHKANHPETQHYISNVWEVDPRTAARGRPVGLLWLSPDCTHFSRAKGGKPREKKTRSLAYVAIRWARAVRPRVIILENVEEFETWGPVDNDGEPIKAMAGRTFKIWRGKLRALGYHVEHRSLVAADYGAPTTRRRLFLIARRDGERIEWPEPTHGKGQSSPWRSAAEIIDWSLPCPSIFGREKPLAEATMQRIAEGVQRYVLNGGSPFVMPITHRGSPRRQHDIGKPLPTVTGSSGGELALVAPLLTKSYGGPNGNRNAGLDVRRPLGTVTAQDHHWLVAAMLSQAGAMPRQMSFAQDRSDAVRAFLVKYYGSGGQQQSLFEPLHTVTAVARFGLVMVHGEPYQISDIGMRMLAPHELFAAQGFPAEYVIAPEFEGKPLTKTAQVRLAGNSVSPPVARRLVAANVSIRRSEAA